MKNNINKKEKFSKTHGNICVKSSTIREIKAYRHTAIHKSCRRDKILKARKIQSTGTDSEQEAVLYVARKNRQPSYSAFTQEK